MEFHKSAPLSLNRTSQKSKAFVHVLCVCVLCVFVVGFWGFTFCRQTLYGMFGWRQAIRFSSPNNNDNNNLLICRQQPVAITSTKNHYGQQPKMPFALQTHEKVEAKVAQLSLQRKKKITLAMTNLLFFTSFSSLMYLHSEHWHRVNFCAIQISVSGFFSTLFFLPAIFGTEIGAEITETFFLS